MFLVFSLINFAFIAYACFECFSRNRHLEYIVIIAFGILFLVPKVSLYFSFSIIVITLYLLKYPRYFLVKMKWPIVFFTLYALIFLLTSRKFDLIVIKDLIQIIGVHFVTVTLCVLFIRDFYGFRKLISTLIIILFINYVLIGFYQYFTGNALVPFIDQEEIFYYTSQYDLQRLRSFMEWHPANSANGILFLICLTIFGIHIKVSYTLIFLASIIALFLTYTRMSWLTFLVVILLYLIMNRNIKTKRLVWMMITVITLFGIIFFLGQDQIMSSKRLSSPFNIGSRMVMWAYFFDNIGDYMWGGGHYGEGKISHYARSSSENYFIQQIITYGIFGILLYLLLFIRFIGNMKTRLGVLYQYRVTIVLMMVAFCLNMMTATYSENMFFLVLGLSFAYKNVVQESLVNKIPYAY